jgi:hypothetical protein
MGNSQCTVWTVSIVEKRGMSGRRVGFRDSFLGAAALKATKESTQTGNLVQKRILERLMLPH